MDFKETFYRDIGLEQPTDWFSIGGSQPPAATVALDR
jgi:hypothetical protein